MGHVRDLPKNPKRRGKGVVGGVDTAKGFSVDYEVLALRSRRPWTTSRLAAAKAESIYLAADPDREGEAICWHLWPKSSTSHLPKTRSKAKTRPSGGLQRDHEEAPSRRPSRIPGQVDAKKVDAQQARRVLDRLVGYAVSPILWDKVRRGLVRGPRAVGSAQAHLRPRAGDPRLQAGGILDGRGPARGQAQPPVSFPRTC